MIRIGSTSSPNPTAFPQTAQSNLPSAGITPHHTISVSVPTSPHTPSPWPTLPIGPMPRFRASSAIYPIATGVYMALPKALNNFQTGKAFIAVRNTFDQTLEKLINDTDPNNYFLIFDPKVASILRPTFRVNIVVDSGHDPAPYQLHYLIPEERTDRINDALPFTTAGGAIGVNAKYKLYVAIQETVTDLKSLINTALPQLIRPTHGALRCLTPNGNIELALRHFLYCDRILKLADDLKMDISAQASGKSFSGLAGIAPEICRSAILLTGLSLINIHASHVTWESELGDILESVCKLLERFGSNIYIFEETEQAALAAWLFDAIHIANLHDDFPDIINRLSRAQTARPRNLKFRVIQKQSADPKLYPKLRPWNLQPLQNPDAPISWTEPVRFMEKYAMTSFPILAPYLKWAI